MDSTVATLKCVGGDLQVNLSKLAAIGGIFQDVAKSTGDSPTFDIPFNIGLVRRAVRSQPKRPKYFALYSFLRADKLTDYRDYVRTKSVQGMIDWMISGCNCRKYPQLKLHITSSFLAALRSDIPGVVDVLRSRYDLTKFMKLDVFDTIPLKQDVMMYCLDKQRDVLYRLMNQPQMDDLKQHLLASTNPDRLTLLSIWSTPDRQRAYTHRYPTPKRTRYAKDSGCKNAKWGTCFYWCTCNVCKGSLT